MVKTVSIFKDSLDFLLEYGFYVIMVVLIILFILVIANSVGWNFNDSNNKKEDSVILVEGLENNTQKGFCETIIHNSKKRETACNKLTKDNCQVSDCCIFLNGKKCVAGNAHGPVYRSDSEKNKINIDNYYYKKKCYGNC